jgi:hypothetical protein
VRLSSPVREPHHVIKIVTSAIVTDMPGLCLVERDVGNIGHVMAGLIKISVSP